MHQRIRLGWVLVPALIAALVPTVGCGGSDEAEPVPIPIDTAPGAPTSEGTGDAGEQPFIPEVSLEQLNRAVAQVNGTPIRARKLNEVTEVNKAEIVARGIPLSEALEREVRRKALDVIIDAELMYQAALSNGLTVDPRQIEQRVQEARAKFASEKEYQDYLAAAQTNEDDFREEAERQLLVQRYMQSIAGDVTVDDETLRNIYEQNQDRFVEDEQVRAAYILVRTDPKDPEQMREDARSRIEEAERRLQRGDDFAQIAREYSQAPNAGKGGDVGFFPRGVMAPQFEEAAFNTDVGEVTTVFQTPFGLNILKVLDRREPRPIPFEEVKPTLTLVVIRQQEVQVVEERLAGLREAAKIEILDESLKGDAEPQQQAPAAEG